MDAEKRLEENIKNLKLSLCDFVLEIYKTRQMDVEDEVKELLNEMDNKALKSMIKLIRHREKCLEVLRNTEDDGRNC